MESKDIDTYEDWLKAQPITLKLEDRTYYKYVKSLIKK